jgi:hypothetical protein
MLHAILKSGRREVDKPKNRMLKCPSDGEHMADGQ